MRNKIRIIFICVIAMLVISVVFVIRIIDYKDNSKYLEINGDYNQLYEKNSIKWVYAICDFLKGNISYDSFPLSDKFRIKFKSIQDVVKGRVMGTLESTATDFDICEDPEKQIMCISVKTGNGLEEIVYQLHYIINDKNELDDIEILDSRVFEDENGSYPHYDKFHYYSEDPIVATDILCFPYRNDFDGDPYRVYVTSDFENKFPNCQDDKYLNDGIVGDTNYLICGDVIQDKEQTNVCYAEFLDINYTKTYKITFEILDNGYINDAKIELYKKEVTKDPEYVKELYEGYKENVRWF